jgi:hypothetical protein
MTFEWVTGTGPDTRVFGPASIQVTDMMDAPGVNSARDFFYDKNASNMTNGQYETMEPVTDYRATFGLTRLFSTTSPTQQFVGSYTVNIYPTSDGSELFFLLNNNSSFKSFGYGVAPAWERGTFAPGGNMRQTYWWVEPRRP